MFTQSELNNMHSDNFPITIGMPQGSVLAPTLFLIFINELYQLQLTNEKVITVTDDIALVFRACPGIAHTGVHRMA